jgi:hypothetical protein
VQQTPALKGEIRYEKRSAQRQPNLLDDGASATLDGQDAGETQDDVLFRVTTEIVYHKT